jgi:hypothetical protein
LQHPEAFTLRSPEHRSNRAIALFGPAGSARKEGEMRNRQQIAAAVLIVLLVAGQNGAATSIPRGYATSQTDLSILTWFGGFDYLPDGRVIVSDSTDVFILDGEGTKTVVARFEQPGLFGSFVKLAPDGHTVYAGESSTGTISVLDVNVSTLQAIGPGTDSVLGTVELNYDLEFDPQGRAFVSAATPVTWQPNRLLLLDKQTGETDLIATVQGNSGPIAFDLAGNLYYSTSTSYPPQPVESVLLFSPQAIDRAIGETHLTEADAETYASGILGFSDMAFDGDGDLFGVTTLGTVVELSNSGGEVLSHTFGAVSPDALGATVVRFIAGTRDFEAYYEDGGTLTFLESDFGSLYRLVGVSTFPEFRVIALGQGQQGTQVRFATESGKQYQVYSCDNLLSDGGWQALGPVLTGTGEPVSVSDDGGEQTGSSSPILSSVRKRFYRVQLVE